MTADTFLFLLLFFGIVLVLAGLDLIVGRFLR